MNYFKPIVSSDLLEWFDDCANQSVVAYQKGLYETISQDLSKDFENLKHSLAGTKEPSYIDSFLIYDGWSIEDASMILVGFLPYDPKFDRVTSDTDLAHQNILAMQELHKEHHTVHFDGGRKPSYTNPYPSRLDGLELFDFKNIRREIGHNEIRYSECDNDIIWGNHGNTGTVIRAIENDFERRFNSALKTAKILQSGDHPDKLTVPYLKNWAANKNIEIERLDWATKQGFIKPDSIIVSEKEPLSKLWEEVTVSLLANHRIALKSDDNRREFSMFDLGLVDKRTNKPNVSGRALVRLSERRKYPLERTATGAEKNVMKKLRESLKSAANMNKNPFTTPNASDGWKPRFTLIDSRNAADVRARQRAIHVPYDDSRGYDQEHDAAGDFLREHEE